jgi:SAM-dependent methyltransferase
VGRSALSAPEVRYRHWAETWDTFGVLLRRLVEREDIQRVCEVGAGAKPSLDPGEVAAGGLEYVAQDIDADELEKADASYPTWVSDMASPELEAPDEFDLVVSHAVLEHVLDAAQFHANVHKLLRPAGFALHLFSTLWEPVFMANRLLPARLTEPLLLRSQPWRTEEGDSAKFRPYYRWCRGPTASQIARLERAGFEVETYLGFFGHGYFNRVRALDAVEEWMARTLVRHPLPQLTSYAVVSLRRG